MNNNNQSSNAPLGEAQQAAVPVRLGGLRVPTDKKDGLFAVLFLIFSISAVWLCFWGEFRSGFTVANWAFLILVTCYCSKSGGGAEKKGFPIFCGISAAVMSVLFSLRIDYTVNPILILAVVTLDCAYFDGMWGRSRYGFVDVRTILDVLNRLFKQTLTKLPVPFRSIFAKGSRGGKTGKSVKVILGLLAAIPVVAVLATLLKWADMAFEQLLFGLVLSVFESPGDAAWTVALGLILFVFILSFVFSIRKSLDSGTYVNRDMHVFDCTVVNTALCAVSALYAVYLISQLSYLFGAFSGLLPEDFSYSQYARRGFFELCAISAINLAIVFVAGALTKRGENGRRSTLNKALSLYICVVTLVLIATAEAKLYLYVRRYDSLTRMRLLPALFMALLAVCFIAVIIRIFSENFPYIKLLVCTAVIMLTAISAADIDTVVAKYNIAAYRDGRISLSIREMSYFGPGATPEILKLLDSDDPDIRYSMKDFLVDKAQKYYIINDTNHTYTELPVKLSIHSFNLDEYREYRAVKDCAERTFLKDYANISDKKT